MASTQPTDPDQQREDLLDSQRTRTGRSRATSRKTPSKTRSCAWSPTAPGPRPPAPSTRPRTRSAAAGSRSARAERHARRPRRGFESRRGGQRPAGQARRDRAMPARRGRRRRGHRGRLPLGRDAPGPDGDRLRHARVAARRACRGADAHVERGRRDARPPGRHQGQGLGGRAQRAAAPAVRARHRCRAGFPAAPAGRRAAPGRAGGRDDRGHRRGGRRAGGRRAPRGDADRQRARRRARGVRGRNGRARGL